MTANDSDVSDGDTLTGSQVVRVYGENLTAPFVTLAFGDVEYTPLYRGEGYIEFILGDNGDAVISVDGSPIMSFEVEGIMVPSILPRTMRVSQYDTEDAFPDEEHIGEDVVRNNVNCINAPIMVTDEYPYILYRMSTIEVAEEDFTFGNVESHRSYRYRTTTLFNVTPLDKTKPCWIAYQGFIVAVFNYTTD